MYDSDHNTALIKCSQIFYHLARLNRLIPFENPTREQLVAARKAAEKVEAELAETLQYLAD